VFNREAVAYLLVVRSHCSTGDTPINAAATNRSHSKPARVIPNQHLLAFVFGLTRAAVAVIGAALGIAAIVGAA
jgi:hypothetical protein